MIYFTINEIRQCYNFARAMRGNHNPDMIQHRYDWEIFRDDFRGKLGEVAVYKYIRERMPDAVIDQGIDYSVTPRGQWDITDLTVNGKNINVKSIKGKSQFLLVECNRYDENGNYRYNNNNGENVRVDNYVLVRVFIDPEIGPGIFKIRSFDDFINRAWNSRIRKEVVRNIYAEVLGGISHEDFWAKKRRAERGILCSVNNLRAIAAGVDIDHLPERVQGNEPQNKILKQNNYIIDSTTGLSNLEDIL